MNFQSEIKKGQETYSSAIEEAHNYTRWMVSPFFKYLEGKILEIGIGHGGYHEVLAPFGEYIGLDIDEKSVQEARKKFPKGNFQTADILEKNFYESFTKSRLDNIVMINVLEHIVEDEKAIENLIAALCPGGHLLLNIPAFNFLYNDLDRLAGHIRRYNKGSMKKLLEGKKVEIVELYYFNPVGGIGWWVNRLKKHHSLNSSAVNSQIKIFEKFILPVSNFLNPLTAKFFGQSIICIARRL